MNSFTAVLGSLLLLWAQCVSSFAPGLAATARGETQTCACADCRGACCCVRVPESGAPVTPLPPPRASTHELAALFIAPPLLIPTPETPGLDEPASADSSANPSVVPLFTRHCARLL